jgi:hypothetical protein
MLKYDVNNGVKKIKVKLAIAVSTVVALSGFGTAVIIPAVSHAAPGAGDGSHASLCGSGHGAFADVNGNFGWLGAEGGAAGYHGVVGQQPSATGYNNSHTNCQQG